MKFCPTTMEVVLHVGCLFEDGDLDNRANAYSFQSSNADWQ